MATYYVDPSTASGQLTGTWTFTTASTAVTAAADGNAVAELAVGDYIKVSDGVVWYKIATVTDDNTLALSRTFLETGVTDGVGTTDNRDVSVAVGTSTANSYVNLHQFTEVARSAGDVCIVRRGKSERIDDWGDLAFTSDGTIVSPITIEADYANAWSDRVDLSGTATATLIFGSKTITFSADISGVLSAGDWIYTSGDAAKDFAYEVASVSTVTVTLYLPYKGDQAGASKTMYNMKSAPIWNTAAGSFQWNFDLDDYWKVQGIAIYGTDPNGNIEIDSSHNPLFIDCIFIANGTGDYGIRFTDDPTKIIVKKTRFYNHYISIYGNASGDAGGDIFIKNSLVNTNNVASSRGLVSFHNLRLFLEEVELKNAGYAQIQCYSDVARVYARNIIFDSSGSSGVFLNCLNKNAYAFVEDYDGVVGDNRQYGKEFNESDNSLYINSTSTTVRSGGGNTSIEVTPTTHLSSNWDYSRLHLFEYPIYADTTSKTYTIYFKTNATADWTADPTNSELWIEAEYWGHASNNYRKIDKSTGVIDFNGSTAWQSLTVTVQPSQAGVLYLRGWYAKTKEAQSNIFYVDTKPIIS